MNSRKQSAFSRSSGLLEDCLESNRGLDAPFNVTLPFVSHNIGIIRISMRSFTMDFNNLTSATLQGIVIL